MLRLRNFCKPTPAIEPSDVYKFAYFSLIFLWSLLLSLTIAKADIPQNRIDTGSSFEGRTLEQFPAEVVVLHDKITNQIECYLPLTSYPQLAPALVKPVPRTENSPDYSEIPLCQSEAQYNQLAELAENVQAPVQLANLGAMLDLLKVLGVECVTYGFGTGAVVALVAPTSRRETASYLGGFLGSGVNAGQIHRRLRQGGVSFGARTVRSFLMSGTVGYICGFISSQSIHFLMKDPKSPLGTR